MNMQRNLIKQRNCHNETRDEKKKIYWRKQSSSFSIDFLPKSYLKTCLNVFKYRAHDDTHQFSHSEYLWHDRSRPTLVHVMVCLTILKFKVQVNSSPPGQNGRHFADGIFKCIFLNEKCCILIRISFNVDPKGPINNKWALVQVMVGRWIGDKPLPEPMLIQFTDAYMRH